MKLGITVASIKETWAIFNYETDSLYGGLRDDLDYEYECEYSQRVEDLEDRSFTAHIGKYKFNFDELESYSDTAKEFLEDIMMNDQKKELKAFHALAHSEEKVVLRKDDIDLTELIKKFYKTQKTHNKITKPSLDYKINYEQSEMLPFLLVL
jgi:CMP-2-keto-3-deoxyoctulosonic acid synthetase